MRDAIPLSSVIVDTAWDGFAGQTWWSTARPPCIPFTLAMKELSLRHSASLDLLKVCSFLHANTIPEELFSQKTRSLGPALAAVGSSPLQWNQLLATMNAYSLVKRQPGEQVLSLHQLVQAAVRANQSEAEQKLWIGPIITTLDHVFPYNTFAHWPNL